MGLSRWCSLVAGFKPRRPGGRTRSSKEVAWDWKSIRTCFHCGSARTAREGPGNVFPGHGSNGGRDGRVAEFGTHPTLTRRPDLEMVLAAHEEKRMCRHWPESAIYRKIKEEVKAGSRPTVKRMVKLACEPRQLLSLDENAGSATRSEYEPCGMPFSESFGMA